MKQCPTCKRTYADDGFTFCLEDGALLSAPFNPAEKNPAPTIRAGGPPPTAVLPKESPEKKTPAATVALPGQPRDTLPDNTVPKTERTFFSSRAFKTIVLAFVIAVPLLGGVILVYMKIAETERSRCAHFRLSCNRFIEGYLYCKVEKVSDPVSALPISPALASLSWQPETTPPPLPDATNVTWTSTAGKLAPRFSEATLDISNLAGREINVTAVVQTKDGCSEAMSTSYVVPSSP